MSPMLDLLTKFSVVFGICMVCYLVQLDSKSTDTQRPNGNASRKLDTSWRYTAIGWQDSSNWKSRAHFPKPIAAKVHPFIWTALIVVAAVGLLIWASDEDDSLAKAPAPPHPLLRHRCQCKPRCKNFCLQELTPNKSFAFYRE